jgi:hypothetical protein
MRNIMLVASVVFGLGACGKSAGDEALSKLEGFKNQICACKDKACAEKVSEEMTKWGEEFQKNNKDKEPSKEQMEKAAKITEELGECMTKLMTGGGE